jgi:hypothetical protein
MVLLENAGRLAGHEAELAEIIDGLRAGGDNWCLATALGLQGLLQSYRGDLDAATATWTEALPLLEALGADADVAFTRLRILWLRIATADGAELAELRAAATREAAAAERHGNRQALALARLGLGQIDRHAGDLESSARQFRLLLDQATLAEFGGPHFDALAQASLAATLAADDDPDGARAALAAAGRLAAGTRDMPILAYVGIMHAQVVHALGDGAADDARAARVLGATVAVRGTDDHSSRDARALAARLRESLGAARFEALYAEAAALPPDEALGVALPATT